MNVLSVSPSRRSRPACMAVAMALLSALMATPALRAADKPKAAAPAKGKPIEPVMSRAELRQCMTQQEQIQTQSDALQKQRSQLEADKVELQRSGQALNEALASLDRSSQEAVDRYNAEATARDRAIDALAAQTNDFNAKVGSNESQREAYAKTCKNRRYDERDEIAIRAGK